jgi:hypothetical protein
MTGQRSRPRGAGEADENRHEVGAGKAGHEQLSPIVRKAVENSAVQSLDESSGQEQFRERVACPTCGGPLVVGDGWVRCEKPSHYARSTMSAETIGDDLRDDEGVAWGRLGADRHARSNPSFSFRIDRGQASGRG